MSRTPLPPMAVPHDSAPAMRRHPTILDVASHAGVSKSTVSNVVRGLPGVSEATRRRVGTAIRELGYRPNVLARQLVQQRTSILGVVVGDLARWAGYCEALKEAGLGPQLKISWTPPSDQAEIDGVERPLLDVFTGPGRATAVFASNDVAAIALQEFADRVSLHVPGDVSIVGFDDVPMAGLARIALTTVAQPRDQLASLGIATITDRI